MRLRASLGARLLAATLTTAAFALATLVALVVLRADQNLKEQALEVSRWSEAELSERLLSDARLAAARVRGLREDVQRRFAAVAQRLDVARAISSGNTVLVTELLRPALDLADLDGAIVFDTKLRALGADRVDAKVLEANAAIPTSVLAAPVSHLTRANDPAAARGFARSWTLDADLKAALAAERTGSIVDVFGRPIFDEFGDVAGVLVGYRLLKSSEPTLQAFSVLSGRDVLIRQDATEISSAGHPFQNADMRPRAESELRSADGGRKVARCEPLYPDLDVCAAAPLSTLERLTEQVTGIGEEHSAALLASLSVAALCAMLLFAFTAVILSQRITRPLVGITETVAEVARGNWRTQVANVDRSDEVGDIARAVVKLQHSLKERDQLREDVVEQNKALLERKHQLDEQNQRFDAALNNMSQGLCMFDEAGRLKVFNGQLLRIYRLDSDAVRLGMNVAELRDVLGGSRSRDEAAELALDRAATSGDGTTTETLALSDGRSVEVSVQPMADGGWVETHEDVTATRSVQARISHMATHDALTGLANRVLFANRLGDAMAKRDHAGRPVAVLCLDLDDFKTVNDSMGHGVGDELLRLVAIRLLDAIPPSAAIARLGGDEFAILETGAEQPAGAQEIAERVLAALKRPFLIRGQVVPTNASIGIAATTAEVEDADHLLRRADLALYAAKADGRGRARLFEIAMEERLQERRWLERDLRKALRTGQLDVHYQPIVSLATNQISGFEALARWRHPERGPVSPGVFIPLAESVGLIDLLGEYILSRACAEAVGWPDHVKVAVNVSPVQFRSEDICPMVARVLAKTGLPSRRLELEITESVVLRQDSETRERLHKLRSLGIRFSMDDFGTGFSSLSSLNSFPFDKIKLDQSFVREAMERDESAAIVRIVADLGRSLNMTTTAEGVETPQQLDRLRASGFCEAQGYLFSPAVPAHEAASLLANGLTLRRAAA